MTDARRSTTPAGPRPPAFAVAVIVDPALEGGLLANAVAVVSIGLGATEPSLAAVRLIDAAGMATEAVSQVPVPVLRADREAIARLIQRALTAPPPARIVVFPSFARAIHDPIVYRSEVAARRLEDEPAVAVGLVGPKSWIRSLTGSMRLR